MRRLPIKTVKSGSGFIKTGTEFKTIMFIVAGIEF